MGGGRELSGGWAGAGPTLGLRAADLAHAAPAPSGPARSPRLREDRGVARFNSLQPAIHSPLGVNGQVFCK